MAVKHKHIKRITLILIALLFVSCYGSWNPFDSDNDVDNRITELENISSSLPASITGCSNSYTVLVFTDLHYGSKSKDCPEQQLFSWLDTLGTEKPKFAISLGDSADTGNQQEYDDYLRFCNKLKTDYGIEMINTPGNHDLYQSNWENWQKNCYPNKSFYYFKTAGLSWYSIDTASGSTGLKQYNSLKQAFKSDPNPKIVFTHYPILEFNLVFGLCDTTERNLLIDLFVKNNVICSLGGHLHYYATDKFDDYSEYCLPSFKYSSSWSLLKVNESESSVSIEIIK